MLNFYLTMCLVFFSFFSPLFLTSSNLTHEQQVVTGSHDSRIKLWDLAAGKCAVTLTNHKKSVRSLVFHRKEYSFASGAPDNIKVWQCPEGRFLRNLSGHNAIVNSLALNEDNVLVSGADNGSVRLWDWKTGHSFQSLNALAQPGSLESEAGVLGMSFDLTGSRLVTCEADKTIKVWREDPEASEETHPVVWTKATKRSRY